MSPFDPLLPLARLLSLLPLLGASRMQFKLLKPLHGWREFVGEVGIIYPRPISPSDKS